MHYSHQLEKRKHKDFLLQQIVDPITGELIEAGHKIVICSACKSAFFEESWEYLGKEHCNQTKTLSKIPVAEIIKIKFKELDFEFEDVEKRKISLKDKIIGHTIGFTLCMLFFGICLLPLGIYGYFESVLKNLLESYVWVILFLSFCLVIGSFGIWIFYKTDEKYSEKSKIYQKYKRLVILCSDFDDTFRLNIDSEKSRLIINNAVDKFSIPFSQIENIEYTFTRKMYKVRLRVKFNFINNKDLKQKTLTTIIEENQMNQWQYFINKLPSHIETKIIGQRI
ncbi:hypothetical protein WAF17_04855 [Bernardetia sp. ABR2-2B]|uniref:hypothetical protein n=1 Tax=Bernardetia sp. ABR2-2B TaxID=3127472 RepID=UPI0030CFD8CA